MPQRSSSKWLDIVTATLLSCIIFLGCVTVSTAASASTWTVTTTTTTSSERVNVFPIPGSGSSGLLSRVPRGGATTLSTKMAPSSSMDLSIDSSSSSSLSSGWSRGDRGVFLSSSFLTMFSLALVAFSPAPALVAAIGSERASSTLSLITSGAAAVEIVGSPFLGSLLDSIGRKPAWIVALLSIGVVHGAVALSSFSSSLSLSSSLRMAMPLVGTIGLAKFVGSVGIAVFFLASQVMISDISASASHSNPASSVSSTLGLQSALVGGGFFAGALTAGTLSSTVDNDTWRLAVIYGTSTMVTVFTAVLLFFGMNETLSPPSPKSKQGRTSHHNHNNHKNNNKNHHNNNNNNNHNNNNNNNKNHNGIVTTKQRLLASPLISCTRILFRRSPQIRRLALLLMVQSLPIYMADTFQILAVTEWNLGTRDYSSFVALFGILNIAANLVGSLRLAGSGGSSSSNGNGIGAIRNFTALATLSSVLSPLGAALFSFRGMVVGSVVGFLGSAQTLGVTAALLAEGAKPYTPIDNNNNHNNNHNHNNNNHNNNNDNNNNNNDNKKKNYNNNDNNKSFQTTGTDTSMSASKATSQGELSGERSSFLALIKVIGPLWYSMLYVKGRKLLGTGSLPFYFNAVLGLVAFVMSQSILH